MPLSVVYGLELTAIFVRLLMVTIRG